MTSPLKVSIIVPVYGVEKYIAEFAVSAFEQTYPYIEYVFVNDGTKDCSIDILEKLIDEKYSHLRDSIIIVNKENGGLPAARKTGLEHATGDYIWHVDPDDWIERDSVESIVSKIRETGADVVYFNLVKEYSDRSKVKRDRPHASDARQEYVSDMYNHRSFGSLCNKCVKRSLYDNPRLIFATYSYAEDTFLTTQLVGNSSCIAFLDKALYHYRKTNPNAITRLKRKNRRREYALNFLRLYENYRDVPQSENPILPIVDDILIQAGWYSIMYRLGLFRLYPYLGEAVRKAKMRTHTDVWIPAQLLVKIVAFFH